MNLFSRALRLTLSFALVSCTGCLIDVPPKAYRTVTPVEQVPNTPEFPKIDHSSSAAPKSKHSAANYSAYLPAGAPCKADSAKDFDHPCLSYIEFDDFGELWQPHIQPKPGVKSPPSQVDAAKDMIRAAMKHDEKEESQPIIVVFVHGWKHDAHRQPLEDTNIQGTKDLLNYLRVVYPDTWLSDGTIPSVGPRGTAGNKNGESCDGSFDKKGCAFVRHPVVGVYIGWRGRSYSEYWPVLQNISYLQRQPAAYRVGNTSLTDTLMELSAEARPPCLENDPFEPYVLMMGHSFGALVLERSLAQAYMREIDQPSYTSRFINKTTCTRHYPPGSENATADPSQPAPTPIPNAKPKFADLVVFVNSAAPSTEAKQVIDLLASHRSEYKEGALRFPAFVSFSSVTDSATVTLLPIGQTISYAKLANDRSSRSKVPQVCFDPYSQLPSRRDPSTISQYSQFSYLKHSAPHFELLQSHELKQLTDTQIACIYQQDGDTDAQDGCLGAQPPALQSPAIEPSGAPLTCESLKSIEPRLDRFGPILSTDKKCYLIQPKNLQPDGLTGSKNLPGPRCNGTPYFVMEVPSDVIPDHNTIFTQQVYQMIQLFLPAPAGQNANDTSAQRKGIMSRQEVK